MMLLFLIGIFSIMPGIAAGQMPDSPFSPPQLTPPEAADSSNPYQLSDTPAGEPYQPDIAPEPPVNATMDPAISPEEPVVDPDVPIETDLPDAPALPDPPAEPSLPDSPTVPTLPDSPETPETSGDAETPGAVPAPAADQAIITTYVPKNAKVYINGILTDLTGTTRRFYSQGLQPNLQYPYDLVIEWTENGRRHRAQQRVLMQAGDHKSIRVGKQPLPSMPTAMSPDDYPTTEITVELPEDAKLFIDDVASPGTGMKRRFATEELAPDAQPVEYVLRAEWVVDGQTLTDTKTISVHGGEKKLVRFDFAEQQALIASRKNREQDRKAIEAVRSAAQWIVGQQHADGGWSLPPYSTEDESCIAGTSLAVLPLVIAGQTSSDGMYYEEVAEGVYYLIERQTSDGGFRAAVDRPIDPFSQAIATIALCETLAQRKDERLRPAVEKAVAQIVKNQDSDGSWTYGTGQPANLSTFGWQVMALAAAERVGVEIDPQVKSRALAFLKTLAVDDGLAYSYQAGRNPTPAMTAEGLLSSLLLGTPTEGAATADVLKQLIANNPAEPDTVDIYYWFYTTELARLAGGQAWNAWWSEVRDSLLEMQQTEGDNAGKWAPAGHHMQGGSPLMMTTLATIILESRFRQK